MDHPKVGGLSDGSFRLWVQALAFCQKFLTDGSVTVVAVKGLRAYSPKRKAELVASGLWVPDTNGGIVVHDYLQWNESRSHVMKSREAARERIQRLRGKRQCNAVTPSEHTENELRSYSGGVVCSSSYLKESSSGKKISTPEGIAAFDRFWAVYPRPEGKRQAEEAWREAGVDAALEAVIVADIAKRVKLGWATEPRFVPNPARYLGERLWQEQFVPRLPRKPDRPETDGRVVPGVEETRRKLAELRRES